jgi:DUF1680 family protein
VLKKINVSIQQTTRYPWEGAVHIVVSPGKKINFPLHLRIPGWAQNSPVPGDTYSHIHAADNAFTIMVNGKPAQYKMEQGYAVIEREWKKNDVVDLVLPMQVNRVVASAQVKENINRVAFQRGPLLYCFEHKDNGGKVMNIVVPDDILFTEQYHPALLQGVVTLEAEAPVILVSADGKSVNTINKKITAIPYYCWANRGEGEMQVWMPRKAMDVKIDTH